MRTASQPRSQRRSNPEAEAAEEGARLDGLIAGTRFRRALERAELKDERQRLAHVAREIAAHLNWIAVSLTHDPLEHDEVMRHANVLKIIDGLTAGRLVLPKQKRKLEWEPFTEDELRRGFVNPLGELWATWTQVFNRTEFAHDAEAMIAVTRTLKALRLAFWNSERPGPVPRRSNDRRFLEAVNTTAHRYLAPLNEDVVSERPDAVTRLLAHLASEMHRPFFIWSGTRRETLLRRRDPNDAELAAAADKITDWLMGALRDGYGFALVKRHLPEDFDNESRQAAVRAVIYAHLRDGTFNPGPDALDHTSSEHSARKTLRAALSKVGFRGNTKALFDADRKRRQKGT